MKHKFSKFMQIAFIAIIATLTFMTSCDDDDDDPIVIPVEDGVYVKGAGTAFTELKANALMDAGINEVGQVEKEGLYEMYLPVKAGTDGFNLVIVSGGVEKTYGPGTVETVEIDGSDWQIVDNIQQGKVAENSGAFTVPSDGFYHFVYDKTTEIFMIIPATIWEVNGFGEMTASAFNTDEMTWKYENANLVTTSVFKFRHSLGWKVIIDETEAGSADNAFNINTNFGGEISGDSINGISSTLIPGGSDYTISAVQTGKYTIELKWTKDAGMEAIYTRTGTADVVEVSWGLIGSAVPDTGWDSDVNMTYDGNDIWSITLDLVAGEIKFRANDSWDINYGDDGADGTLDAGGANIAIAEDGNYTISMNTAELTYTVTKN